jgi:hypothetical protein
VATVLLEEDFDTRFRLPDAGGAADPASPPDSASGVSPGVTTDAVEIVFTALAPPVFV